jgi:hypothetical protein
MSWFGFVTEPVFVYLARAWPSLSVSQPHVAHVQPPHMNSWNEAHSRTLGAGVLHDGQFNRLKFIRHLLLVFESRHITTGAMISISIEPPTRT